jgi:hypothetical protein
MDSARLSLSDLAKDRYIFPHFSCAASILLKIENQPTAKLAARRSDLQG